MPVVGAVLHLEPNMRNETLDWLSGLDGVAMGSLVSNRIPVVGTTDSRAADKALWRLIRHNPYILRTELVFADFADLHDSQPVPEVLK